MDFVADSVPAILVLGGILLIILGISQPTLNTAEWVYLIVGVILFLLKEGIIKT